MLQAPQEIAGLERRAWLAAELVGDEQLGALVPRPPEFGETVQAAVVERREIPRHPAKRSRAARAIRTRSATLNRLVREMGIDVPQGQQQSLL